MAKPREVAQPWKPGAYPKQEELMEATQPGVIQNLVLASGPRLSGKTIGCHHCVAQHLWQTDRANFCILSVTQSVGIDSGVWQHLSEIYLPQWIEAGFGFEWVREPYIQNVTKKPIAKLTNRHGTVSTVSLESLKNEDEVEARFKGKSYSGIWVNEGSKFKKRKTFDTLLWCLREPHLRTEDHLFLMDTNPDLELGAQSWIYKLWYVFRTASPEDLAVLFPDLPAGALKPLQRRLRLMEFTVDDNLWMTEEKKGELLASLIHNKELVDAYFYGRWVTSSTDALFYEVFRPSVHVVGEEEHSGNADPLILWPHEGCYELIAGHDPGPRNSAACIIDKDIQQRGNEEVAIFNVLDELIITREDFDLGDYVEAFVEKMEFWERAIGKPGQVPWRSWADRNTFEARVPFSDLIWSQQVYVASAGAINLMGSAVGGRGSVAMRVDLIRKLLWEERIFISRSKCPNIIQMLQSIKRGKSEVAIIERGSRFKHAFDCLSYAIGSELATEINRSVITNMRRQRSESTLVSVPV